MAEPATHRGGGRTAWGRAHSVGAGAQRGGGREARGREPAQRGDKNQHSAEAGTSTAWGRALAQRGDAAGPRHGRRGAAVWAAAALVAAGLALAGCSFDLPPKATPRPTATRAGNPATIRLADAPALLVQCAIDQAGLRPGSQDWLRGQNVRINTTDALNFRSWFTYHDTPGPYQQTFTIDGHQTHYLAFGATWVHKNGQWVPAHTALNDPAAQRTSIYAWSLWTAAHDRLPPLVCGTSVTAHGLQAQIFGPSANPW